MTTSLMAARFEKARQQPEVRRNLQMQLRADTALRMIETAILSMEKHVVGPLVVRIAELEAKLAHLEQRSAHRSAKIERSVEALAKPAARPRGPKGQFVKAAA